MSRGPDDDGTRRGTTPGGRSSRFGDFDVVSQQRHWDDVTRAVVMARLQPRTACRFFTAVEQRTAAALLDQLLDQRGEPRVPVVEMIDSRLAEGATDGWHHADMPHDDQTWRASLAALDDDARTLHGEPFAACDWQQQAALLVTVHDLRGDSWHGLRADWLWDLWMRYACTAFYSHPLAWNEIGFGGPAYPRGYKNARVGGREPWEVADTHIRREPAR